MEPNNIIWTPDLTRAVHADPIPEQREAEPRTIGGGSWPARTWTAAEIANAVEMNQIRDQLNDLHDTQTGVVLGTMPKPLYNGNGVTYVTTAEQLALVQMPYGLSVHDTILVDLCLAYSVYNVQFPYISMMAWTPSQAAMICEPTRFSSNHAAHIRLSIRRHAATATYVLVNSIGAGLFGIANQFGSQWSVVGQIPDWQAGWYIYIAQAGVPSGQYMHWGYSITRFFGGD